MKMQAKRSLANVLKKMMFAVFLGGFLSLLFVPGAVFSSEISEETPLGSEDLIFIQNGNTLEIHPSERLKKLMEIEEERSRESLFLHSGPIFLAGLIFLAVGIIYIFYPKTAYRVWERWKSKADSEASESYKAAIRIEGLLTLILGVLLIGIFLFGFF